jgi:tRNA threonylcarbamoyl adenosine modification protein YjeE
VPHIPPGTAVFLEGELGAGKSTLAREFVRAFCGADTEFSGSPTYPLCIEYQTREGLRLAHMDFYRVKSLDELEERGLLEVIWDPRTRSLIEWGSLFPEVADQLRAKGRKTLHVSLEVDPDDPERRRIFV